MEKLNVESHEDTLIDILLQREMIVAMVEQQIASIEALMSSTSKLVSSPHSYNHCANLLRQVSTYIVSAYMANIDPVIARTPDGEPVITLTPEK